MTEFLVDGDLMTFLDDFMSDLTPLTPIIDRGLALHKMIR